MKWGGVVVTMLLVVVWIGSGWYAIGADSGWNDEVEVTAGSCQIFIATDHGLAAINPRNSWFGTTGPPGKGKLWSGKLGWELSGLRSSGPPFRNVMRTAIYIPLWFLAASSLLGTVVAWRLDALARRRERVGRCPKCHYDRAGLAAGAVCPECGGWRHEVVSES